MPTTSVPRAYPIAAPLVSLEQVRFAWPGGARVIDLPRFEMAPGERLFLHGPSGSGKSTLLNLIAGMVTPESGRIEVLGVDLRRLNGAARDRHRADHIGFIFQMFNLIPYLSVMENTCLPCEFSAHRRARAMATGGSVQAEALRLLAHLDMADPSLLRRRVTDLSVGQQQRVAAARALLGSPALIIADEPTSALDSDRRLAFVDLLFAECARAATALLFVSHDRTLAPRFDRQVALTELNRMDP